MIRLIQIEWYKIRHHRFFWIGMGLFISFMVLTLSYFGQLSIFGTGQEPDPEEGNMMAMMIPKNLTEAGFYQTPYIWQNTAYLAGFFKFIPAFLMLFFMSTEFEYRTFRQNVIDGLSIPQFFISKFSTVVFFSLLATLSLGLSVLFLGLFHNEGGFSALMEQSSFLFAYFTEVFFLLCLAFFFGILLRKSALAIIIMLIYYLMEPALGYYLGEPLKQYLPTRPSRDLIQEPFSRLFNVRSFLNIENIDEVNWKLMALSLIYSMALAGASLLILKKRDL